MKEINCGEAQKQSTPGDTISSLPEIEMISVRLKTSSRRCAK